MSASLLTRDIYVVEDDRTQFLVASLGWRGDQKSLAAVRTHATQVLCDPSIEALAVHREWTPGEGILLLTVALAPHQFHRDAGSPPRNGRFRDARDTVRLLASVIPPSAVSLVVPSGELNSLADSGLIESISLARRRVSADAQSSLQQTYEQGYEQAVVCGSAPVDDPAATFVALCALSPGPGTLLHDAFEASGKGVVSVTRGLDRDRPTVTWSCVTKGSGSVDLFHELLGLIDSVNPVSHRALIDRSIGFARANMARASRSASSITQLTVLYAVMGWGAELVALPEQTFSDISDERVLGALRALTEPIRKVTGW